MSAIRQIVVALMALPNSSDRSTTTGRIETVSTSGRDVPERVLNSISAKNNHRMKGGYADDRDDYSIIGHGGIYIEHNWINAEQVAGLQRDIFNLRHQQSTDTDVNCNYFQPSGLSNRVDGDPNEFGPSDRLTCTITSSLPGDRKLRAAVEEKLEHLKLDLQEALGIIPTNNNHDGSSDGLELAEQYYSISPTGSFLPRHMDERHEQTKGDKGWMTDSRRSISWLLYLNDCNWGGPVSPNAGGDLRAYCRRSNTAFCGSHDGNIQVGWLSNTNSNRELSKREIIEDGWDSKEAFDPVFLDSWVKTPTMPMLVDDAEYDQDTTDSSPLQWRPLSALYRMVKKSSATSSSNGKQQQPSQQHERDYISDAFGSDSPSWPSDTNLNAAEFASALASQLRPSSSLRNQQFVSTEAVHDHPIDIAPTGGTLVMFDSVAIPHEVLPTTRGERLVMAGWFHEEQQPFPEWYGT